MGKYFMINYSVIIPHYNDVESLKKCLSTIPIRNDIEIIVVNDGLKEETEKLSIEINSDNRDCLYIYANEGTLLSAGACRNTGIKHAIGKWLVFSDADDYFTDDAFETMDIYLDDKADIIFFESDSINYPSLAQGDRHRHLNRLIDGYIDGKYSEDVLKYGWRSPCAKMVKLNMVNRYNICFDEIRFANDILFSVMTGHYASRIAVCNRVIYIIVKKDNTLTTNISPENFKCRLDVFIAKYLFVKDKVKRSELPTIMGGRPFWRIINGFRNYGLGMSRYVIKKFAENGVCLW